MQASLTSVISKDTFSVTAKAKDRVAITSTSPDYIIRTLYIFSRSFQLNSTRLRIISQDAMLIMRLSPLLIRNKIRFREHSKSFVGYSILIIRRQILKRAAFALLRASSALLRASFGLLRGNSALLRRSFALLRGNSALLRGNSALLRGNFALLRGSFALLKANSALLRESFALLRGNFALKRGKTLLLNRELL